MPDHPDRDQHAGEQHLVIGHRAPGAQEPLPFRHMRRAGARVGPGDDPGEKAQLDPAPDRQRRQERAIGRAHAGQPQCRLIAPDPAPEHRKRQQHRAAPRPRIARRSQSRTTIRIAPVANHQRKSAIRAAIQGLCTSIPSSWPEIPRGVWGAGPPALWCGGLAPTGLIRGLQPRACGHRVFLGGDRVEPDKGRRRAHLRAEAAQPGARRLLPPWPRPDRHWPFAAAPAPPPSAGCRYRA